MGPNDGWEEVTDPSERQVAQASLLPAAPPRGAKAKAGGGGPSPQDRKALGTYRDMDDQANALAQDSKNFLTRADRFHTGPGKSMLFGAMYPSSDGWAGPIKQVAGAALRGTLGQLYSNRDHDDYQYLSANAAALNNAALRLNKGVQTEGDAQRIAKENVGVDKTPQTNRDLFNDATRNAMAIAHARKASASKWIATYGSLAGTTNVHGMTYDDWFDRVIKPQALQQARPAAPSKGGWSIVRN